MLESPFFTIQILSFHVSEIILFPFGLENGDSSLRVINDMVAVDPTRQLFDQEIVSETIRPETGFPFGRIFYPGLYVRSHIFIITSRRNSF